MKRPATTATCSSTSRSSCDSIPSGSTSLSHSIANASARYKKLAYQQNLLSKNPLLRIMTQEIPWKNVLELGTLRFFNGTESIWHENVHPQDLLFVLFGAFVASHHKKHDESEREEDAEQERHKAFEVGDVLGAFYAERNVSVAYQLRTARFKSVALLLPRGKFKTLLRHLSAARRLEISHILFTFEKQVLCALNLPVQVLEQVKTHQLHPQLVKNHHSYPQLSMDPPRCHTSAGQRSRFKENATATVASASSTSSRATLQTARPQEHDVDSTLLILHDLRINSNTNANAKALSSHTLNPVQLLAKKHTQRRMEGIKMPLKVSSIPSSVLQYSRSMDQLATTGDASILNLTPTMLSISDKRLSSTKSQGIKPFLVSARTDFCTGRLLQPMKKPVCVHTTEEVSGTKQAIHVAKNGGNQPLLLQNRCTTYRNINELT